MERTRELQPAAGSQTRTDPVAAGGGQEGATAGAGEHRNLVHLAGVAACQDRGLGAGDGVPDPHRNEDTGGFESGVIAHGPHAEALADEYVNLLRRWAAHDHRRRGAATFRYMPGPAPSPLPQNAVLRRHGIVTATWHYRSWGKLSFGRAGLAARLVGERWPAARIGRRRVRRSEMGLGVGITAAAGPFSCHGPTGTIMTSAEAVKRWTALWRWASISAMNNELLPIAKRVRFVELSAKALRALADGDLAGGSAEAGVALDEHFVCDRARRIFGYRADQLAEDPSAAPWITRAAVSEPDGAVVGDAGFHGPPDEAGMVEVGYTVVARYRRQGYARAMLTALLARAAAEPGVRTVRATIGSDNNASLATIAGFGFTRVGERGTERDGLAIVFEVPADATQAE